MPAAINEDFRTYQGDDVYPVFTVKDDAGVVVDISTVSNITWSAKRDEATAAAVTKTMAAGQIAFSTNGVDGKFYVKLLKADTALLSGFYIHQAKIADAGGLITTVTVGRMLVALPSSVWTYDPSQIANSTRYQVRRLVGDVIAEDPQILDAEVDFFITQRANAYGAAAECCRSIAAQYSRKVDTTTPGELVTHFSTQQKAYAQRAVELEARSSALGAGAMPYAGGISISDKINVQADTDRVQPSFNIGLMDNITIPVGPVGNETPTQPGGGDTGSGITNVA